MRALDLFAGPGGFDLGAAALGLRPLGIEWDDAACATRAAAGLDTLQGDVSLLDPVQFAPRALLIGSPPCPTFSTAGDQGGNLATDLILACATALTRGEDTRAAARDAVYARLLPTAKSPERAARDAVMTMLVVEPLRYALALRPERIALEQVPAVLPIWREVGRLLEPLGYRFWAGILNAADHGVPQTRRRAFLLASRSGPVSPPRPTHCRGGALTLDGELLPWVSMAAALGWGMTARPTHTVTAGGTGSGGGVEVFASDDVRNVIARERDSGRWTEPSSTIVGTRRSKDGMLSGRSLAPGEGVNVGGRNWIRTGANTMKHSRQGSKTGDGGVVRYERSTEEPAPTVDGKAGTCWTIHEVEALEERQAHGVRRGPHEPAPTITASLDNGNLRWIVNTRGESESGGNEFDASEPSWAVTGRARSSTRTAPGQDEPLTLFTNRGQDDHGNRQTRDGGSPAPTVSGKSGGQWYWGSPETTVSGDPGITARSHHEHGEQGRDATPSEEARNGNYDGRSAIRITAIEAAILQGMPPDYPFQGSRTAVFSQIGNLVPPPLAEAVLRALLA